MAGLANVFGSYWGKSQAFRRRTSERRQNRGGSDMKKTGSSSFRRLGAFAAGHTFRTSPSSGITMSSGPAKQIAMRACLLVCLALPAAALLPADALAQEVTFRAIGTINSPSPLAGETMTVFYTFDSGTPPYFPTPCGSATAGFIPPDGKLYPQTMKSVTYSINGAPAVSIGTIDDMDGPASICLASDAPTQVSGQNGYANVYDATATSVTGYFFDVNVTAQSLQQFVIVPRTENITDRPNLATFERDLGSGEISGSALIYVIDNGGHAVGGAPATLTSLVQVQGLSRPSIVPSIIGTQGANGWYVSRPTTLEWAVSGKPAPAKSGCGKVVVPDTMGTSYACSATNEIGDATDTVLIKKDSVAPAIQIKKPTNGAIYAQNQAVVAAYTCTDTTSGIASCVGTVAAGAKVPTTTEGSYAFSVTATDNAGNTHTQSVSYSVDPAAAAPVFSLKAGTYQGPQSVSMTDATSGATIYYTLDGSVPTTSSTVYAGAAIPISVSETLKAIAEAPGYARSALRSAAYTIN